MRHCDFLVFNAKCVGIAGFRRDRFFYVRRKRISGSDFSFDADLYDGTIFSVRQIDKAGEKQSKSPARRKISMRVFFMRISTPFRYRSLYSII